MSDLDNDELIATRKLHGQDDGLYRETSDKNVAQDIEFLKSNEADALYFRGNPKLKSAVESVLERNKELEAKNKYLESLSECQHYYLENSIPTQKVIDKIEELKEVRKIALERKMMSSVESFEITIGHLEELLEEK